MTSTSPGTRVVSTLICGLAFCGLQLFFLLNAKPGAYSPWLIGGFVGSVIGTAIGVALAARPVKPRETKALPAADRQQASEKLKRWAKKAYIVCVVAWVVAALTMIPLSMVEADDEIAHFLAIAFGTVFFAGLAALIIGKALGDASKR